MGDKEGKVGMSSKSKKKVKEIRIEGKWCKRCGICVEFCPGKVLTLENMEPPAATHLEGCTVCRLCEMRCPDYAISVEEENNRQSAPK